MNYVYFIIRNFLVYVVLLVSGCSTYNPTIHQYAIEKFNQLTPHYISTQQGEIEFYRCGNGSPIVLIPGYSTDVSSWNRDFLATLARHHQIIVLNNRNVGGSQVFTNSYTSEDLANDTYQLIKKLGLNKPAIVGISMGGMIAQQLAVLHPDTIGYLVLVNTSIAGQQSVKPTPIVEKKLLGLPKHQFGFYISAIDLFFPPPWKMQMAYSLAADRFQPKSYIKINSDSVRSQQQHLIMNWFTDNATAQKIHQLHLPVLILNGEADIVIPPVNSIILANLIPDARLVRWKDGGHAMIYQYPVEMGNTINHFIFESEK